VLNGNLNSFFFIRKHLLVTEDDGLKAIVGYFEDLEDSDDDDDGALEIEELQDEEGGLDMIQMAIDDDPKDMDWLPPRLRHRVQDRIAGAPDYLQ
jgi:hypothetical protein